MATDNANKAPAQGAKSASTTTTPPPANAPVQDAKGKKKEKDTRLYNLEMQGFPEKIDFLKEGETEEVPVKRRILAKDVEGYAAANRLSKSLKPKIPNDAWIKLIEVGNSEQKEEQKEEQK